MTRGGSETAGSAANAACQGPKPDTLMAEPVGHTAKSPSSLDRPTSLWLRDRAESYWRDSRFFDDNGAVVMATAYRTIANELRRCATEVEA